VQGVPSATGVVIVAARTNGPIRRGGLLAIGIVAALVLFMPASAAGACSISRFSSTDVPKSIPDPGTTVSTITVPAGTPIHDLDLRLGITHPFDSDLVIELVPPAGRPLTLAEGVGMWGDDFTGTIFDDEASSSVISNLPPFTGRFRPAEPLSALDGSARAGTWKLRVTDRIDGYQGELTGWRLDIKGCADSTQPTGQAITAPTTKFQTAIQFPVGWAAGADPGSGIASRDVDYWRATSRSGFGATVHWQRATTRTSASFTGTAGSEYCFSERLRDRTGNESAFSTLRCTALPVNDATLIHGGSWSRGTGAGNYRGDYSQASAKGAQLTLPVSGQSFALLATTCPVCGAVDVFLGSQRLARLSLHSSVVKRKRLLAVKTFDSLRTGQLRIVTLSDRKVIVDGVGVARPPIQQLPKIHASAGAPGVAPLPTGVPAGDEGVEGTLITVTTSSDTSDGNAASVADLEANPGADGEISLREAINATNNDPGAYTVHFAAALAGQTIAVGPMQLPAIRGQGLMIDGDIDGDGDPDITIADGADLDFGLILESSDNRLHALAIRDFGIVAVALRPPPTSGHTLPHNTIAGLRIEGVNQGVVLGGGEHGNEDTDIHWTDTRVVGNTIDALDGVILSLHHTTGDSIGRSTIAGNSIAVDPDGTADNDFSQFGVQIGSGLWADSDRNLVSETLIAHNSIEGTPESAIWLNAGGSGAAGTASVLEDVRVLENRLELDPLNGAPGTCCGTTGISVLAGDDYDPAEDDLTRRVDVVRNLIDGYGREGINVVAACCETPTGNVISDLEVAGNVLRSEWGTDAFNRGIAIRGGGGHGNTVSDARVRANTIAIEGPTDAQFPAGELVNAGIVITGGFGSADDVVEDVSVVDNRVATALPGVVVHGGFGLSGFGAPPGGSPATDNTVRGVVLRGNLILDAPTFAAQQTPGIKGISLIGGAGWLDPSIGPWQATGNSLSCVGLHDNVVVGVLNDRAIKPNVGSGASGNTATLGGC
jgi:subtilisin-like proprotein convertase family protein